MPRLIFDVTDAEAVQLVGPSLRDAAVPVYQAIPGLEREDVAIPRSLLKWFHVDVAGDAEGALFLKRGSLSSYRVEPASQKRGDRNWGHRVDSVSLCGLQSLHKLGTNARAAGRSGNYATWQRCWAPSRQGGIGAQAGWSLVGGRGDGVRVVDIEEAWNLSHEDLVDQNIERWTDVQNDYHGTAVLGLLCASAGNGQGVSGIVDFASVAVARWERFDLVMNPFNILRYAVSRCLAEGRGPRYPAVILVEVVLERSGILQLPLSAWLCGREAIAWATKSGIHVIEAAGNSGVDLQNEIVGGLEDPGSILVGSACPLVARRLDSSNHGESVSLSAHGLDVVTCGHRRDSFSADLQERPDPASCYTKSFGGTSGAAAIVAGALVSLLGVMASDAGRDPLGPADLRNLLRVTGHLKAPGVGPRPDLAQATLSLAGHFNVKHTLTPHPLEHLVFQ